MRRAASVKMSRLAAVQHEVIPTKPPRRAPQRAAASPFETLVPDAATSLLQAQHPETNFLKADARRTAAALADAAGRSTGSDAQGAALANSAF